MPLLLQTIGSYTEQPIEFFQALIPYFKQSVRLAGEVLWTQHDPADGLYLIESGSLRATYAYENYPKLIQETMVAGTIAGDLSTLSETSRNATVVVERDCVLWKLNKESLNRLEVDNPEVARKFIRIVLKGDFAQSPGVRYWIHVLTSQPSQRNRKCCRAILLPCYRDHPVCREYRRKAIVRKRREKTDKSFIRVFK